MQFAYRLRHAQQRTECCQRKCDNGLKSAFTFYRTVQISDDLIHGQLKSNVVELKKITLSPHFLLPL